MSFSSKHLIEKYGFEKPFKADPLLKKAMPHFKDHKRVLDVGCGEGADSVFFAEQGFQVDAIDVDLSALNKLKAYLKDHPISTISIHHSDVIDYAYPKKYYDVINCLLVGCCMRRSEFEQMLIAIKQAIKPGGLIIMSLRNYLDVQFEEFLATEKMIEPNTFRKKDDCCKIRYYIEKGRLRQLLDDFEILYYYEGLSPDKYQDIENHGDSYIICRSVN